MNDSARVSVDGRRDSATGANGAITVGVSPAGPPPGPTGAGAVPASTAAPGASKLKRMAGSLIQKEDRSIGSVDKRVYMTYLRAWGPHLRLPLTFLAIAICTQGFQV